MTAPTPFSPAWLLDRVALYLRRPASTIDPAVSLAEYGMDSVMALSLCGDLEEEFGLEVEPTLLWDHPTVESLLAHLPTVLAGRGAPTAGTAMTATTADGRYR
ncbi:MULTISPECIES: acyl carrier protein [unclassified Streptomyces]|uniref:acyl carrier protein n=1 Tax=unclassified Streptomyces TaxID=2593676 RepID=UPI00109E5499|nr:acyl carrier protein [Streptomyces sp. A1136]THA54614.1 acyl carrier protein [Streptomyces sp. A1136]